MQRRRLVSYTVYLAPDQIRRLRSLHTKTRVPVAVYIRDALDEWLTKNDHDTEVELEDVMELDGGEDTGDDAGHEHPGLLQTAHVERTLSPDPTRRKRP